MRCEITLVGENVRVRSPYAPALVQRFRAIPGARPRYDKGTGKFDAWFFPAVKDVLLMVCDACGVLPEMLPADLRERVGDFSLPEQPAPDLGLLDGHTFLTAPYEHQRVNLARLIGEDRWLLADEQGTGKSHAVVNRVLNFHDTDGRGGVLVVCPKSVVRTWREQFAQHGMLDTALAVNGDRQSALDSRVMVKVTNYEAVQRNPADYLEKDWAVLVFDEIHRIKNVTAKTSRACQALSAKARYVYGLSGTPAPNGLEDWLGVLEAVSPGLLPCKGASGAVTKTAFEARYTVKSQIGEGGPWVVSGYRNVQELHGVVRSITSRVTKAEALDLPPKVYSARTVNLEGEQKRVYNELRSKAVARLTGLKKEGTLTVRNVLTESLRLLQVVGGFVPDDDGLLYELNPKAKVQALEDVLEEVGDRQVVVWCQFVEEVKFLCWWLEDRFGKKAVPFYGEMNAPLRNSMLELFRSGDADVFVATAATGGVGINGLQVADTQVYYSRNYSLTDYLQSQDRLHRIGQRRSVSVIKLLAHNTVDQRVDEALEQKRDLQEMLLRRPEEML